MARCSSRAQTRRSPPLAEVQRCRCSSRAQTWCPRSCVFIDELVGVIMSQIEHGRQKSEQISEEQYPSTTKMEESLEQAAPKWIAALGVLGSGLLYLILPDRFIIGPDWLLLAIQIVLLVPIVLLWRHDHPLSHRASRLLMHLLLSIITLALIVGVTLLIINLPSRTADQATSLLRTGVSLWLSNILVFALWYWELDGGGPSARHQKGYKAADFLFPQQLDGNPQRWAPNFIDYLFLAFTAATALSPTDTYPLSRPAKGLMIIEALTAMLLIVVLVGRAVNIL